MIEAALYTIPADDRETWVQMAMAIKSEMGEDGFFLWDAWSQTAASYKAASAKAVWRSVKQGGGITIRTLYKLAREHGYQGETDVAPRPQSPDAHKRLQAEVEMERKRHRQAADNAADMLKRATQSWHPYLLAKGFPEERGFILDDLFLIPMRDLRTNRINSVQMIDAEGGKKFLTGGKAKGSVFMLGSGSPTWFVEGYASGLSLRCALRSLYRQDRVIVCFSAANLAHVALSIKRGFVYADNDQSGTGEKAAKATGLPWTMSEVVGNDVNDDHQQAGIRSVACRVNQLMRQSA